MVVFSASSPLAPLRVPLFPRLWFGLSKRRNPSPSSKGRRGVSQQLLLLLLCGSFCTGPRSLTPARAQFRPLPAQGWVGRLHEGVDSTTVAIGTPIRSTWTCLRAQS